MLVGKSNKRMLITYYSAWKFRIGYRSLLGKPVARYTCCILQFVPKPG